MIRGRIAATRRRLAAATEMRYGGFLLLLLVVFAVVKFWLWIAGAAAIAVLLCVLWKMTGQIDQWLERRGERRAARRKERAAIAARADEQNRLYLAGDERGTYGEYRPEIYPDG